MSTLRSAVCRIALVALVLVVSARGARAGEIHDAILKGDVEKVRELLEKDAKLVESLDPHGARPLQVAAAHPEAAMAKLLLEKGADPKARGRGGRTALHRASPAVIPLLLEKGLEIDVTDEKGQTPLHDLATMPHPGNWASIRALLARKADVAKRDQQGWTPLHTAAQHGFVGAVVALLGAKADARAKDKQERTPLHVVAESYAQDDVVVAALLLKNGADPKAKDADGKTAVDLARAKDRKELAAVLEKGLASYVAGIGPEVAISASRDVSDASRLAGLLALKPALAAAADPTSGDTPLHLTCWNDADANLDYVETLIAANAPVNAKRKDGRTPLHNAAHNGAVKVGALLLAAKADPNAGSDKEGTPLHVAAGYGRKELVELLLARKANANAKDATGRRPIHNACERGNLEMVQLLVEKGSADVNATENDGQTPLHRASGSTEVLKYLLSKKAKTKVADERGYTLIHAAAISGNVDAIKLLLAAKVPAGAKDKAGRTAADVARQVGQTEAERFLRERGG